ncbi:hypothetical protein [Methylomagnum sp.]
MYAIRQIIEDPQDSIFVPQELRHRPIEVLFIALEQDSEASAAGKPKPHRDAINAFRGKGKGGTVAALLADRAADREREA